MIKKQKFLIKTKKESENKMKNLMIEVVKRKNNFLTNIKDEISVSSKIINECIDDIKKTIVKSNHPNLTLIYNLDNTTNKLFIKRAFVQQ